MDDHCRNYTVRVREGESFVNSIFFYRKYGTEVEESVALWKLLDYIDSYRTPLYNMMLHFIRNRVSSLHSIIGEI